VRTGVKRRLVPDASPPHPSRRPCPKRKLERHKFDYIIAGAGSAGSVLAARLSEDPDVSVLLLESGPTDRNPLVDIPLGSQFLQGTSRDWQAETEPQEHACREIVCSPNGSYAGSKGCCRWPLGRGLGGGSSINYMAYVRGNAADFDDWQAKGAKRWNGSLALKYFKKAENNQMLRYSFWHGTEGPMRVSEPRMRNPVTAAFVEGCVQAGQPDNADYNGASQEGCSRMQSTTYLGQRWSVARGYLWPAMGRRNLHVMTYAEVLKVDIVCSDDGKNPQAAAKRRHRNHRAGAPAPCNATSVIFMDRRGRLEQVMATREITLNPKP
jgi:choline dehydrogenase